MSFEERCDTPDGSGNVWRDPNGSGRKYFFNGVSGLNQMLANGCTEFDVYKLFCTDELIDLLVVQTNLYANQSLNQRNIREQSRLKSWKPTDKKEMRRFLGIIGYMGLVRMPSIRDYWSTDRFFANDTVSSTMPRNRFELVLSTWHFADNEVSPENDRLYKLQPLVDLLVRRFQEVYTPGEVVCVDESIIPFKGRLILKQYMPQKTHKYGVKIFKVCFGKGYTWNLKIYAGKRQDCNQSLPTDVVLTLCGQLLNAGRVIVTDNYYTSMDLAKKLLEKQTNLLGTLRSNRKGNPKTVINKRLKKGELIAKQSENGITVLKWCDKRDILVLSTLHGDETESVNRFSGNVNKPRAIIDYNAGKSSIDLSDQLSSYSTPLRRSLKWYRKVAIELLLGAALVNAHIVYCQVSGKKTSITDFKKAVVKELLRDRSDAVSKQGGERQPNILLPVKIVSKHTFCKTEGSARKGRKYCRGCYDKKVRGEIQKNKVKKVTTYCKNCPGEPRFCLECFNQKHK